MWRTSLVAYSGLFMLGAVAMTGPRGRVAVFPAPAPPTPGPTPTPPGAEGLGRGDVPYSPGWKLGSTGT